MRTSRILLVAVGFALASLVGCRGPTGQHPADPRAFLRAAAAFTAASPTNRYERGVTVADALPHCPEVGRIQQPFNLFVSYDYSKPSFLLTRKDALHLLGTPYRSSVDSVEYLIRSEESGKHQSFLTVQLDANRVVGSEIHGH